LKTAPSIIEITLNRGPEVFANPGGYLMTGFHREDGSRWARPVGVAVGPDGALYFTSDAGANALFRLSPGNDQPRG
jgi:glucose/arabinose dehydrogenase